MANINGGDAVVAGNAPPFLPLHTEPDNDDAQIHDAS
jgi:hypothetical protein